MKGEYKLLRQGGGRTAFAHVHVELMEWDERGERVTIDVDPTDYATALPEESAELFNAAKKGCSEFLHHVEGDDAKRWRIVIRKILINIVDTRPDAVAAAAFLAAANALGAGQRFQLVFQNEWRVVPAKK